MDRAAVVSAVLALVGAAPFGEDSTVEESATVAEHQGDDRLFNEGAVFPYVGVGYLGGSFRGALERGAVTYQADVGVDVVVQTEDTSPDDRDGHGAALGLLGALEAALEDADVSGIGAEGSARLHLESEERTFASAGLYEFTQRWRLKPLFTR